MENLRSIHSSRYLPKLLLRHIEFNALKGIAVKTVADILRSSNVGIILYASQFKANSLNMHFKSIPPRHVWAKNMYIGIHEQDTYLTTEAGTDAKERTWSNRKKCCYIAVKLQQVILKEWAQQNSNTFLQSVEEVSPNQLGFGGIFG